MFLAIYSSMGQRRSSPLNYLYLADKRILGKKAKKMQCFSFGKETCKPYNFASWYMEVISGQLIVSLHVSHSQCELISSNKFAILWNGDDWTWRYMSLPLSSWSLNIQHKTACYMLFSWNSLYSSNWFPQNHGFESIRILSKNPSQIFYKTTFLRLVFTRWLWQCCVLHLQLDLPSIAATYSWCSLLNCSSIMQPSLQKYLTKFISWVSFYRSA